MTCHADRCCRVLANELAGAILRDSERRNQLYGLQISQFLGLREVVGVMRDLSLI